MFSPPAKLLKAVAKRVWFLEDVVFSIIAIYDKKFRKKIESKRVFFANQRQNKKPKDFISAKCMPVLKTKEKSAK